LVELKSRIFYLIYKTLVLDFGISAVREVFEQSPCVINDKPLPSSQFYEQVFTNNLPPISFEYGTAIYKNVELFLERNGIAKPVFMKSLLHKRTSSFQISSKAEIFSAIEPHLSELYSDEDPRYFILRIIVKAHSVQIPHSRMSIASQTIKDGVATSFLEILYSRDEYEKYSYNLDMWKVYIIKEAPLMIGASPFDKVVVRADCRKFDEIIPDYRVSGSDIFIGDLKVGKTSTYKEFLKESGIDHPKMGAKLDVIGIKTISEYKPNDKDYPLLRNNCFYGASSNLIEVEFKPEPNKLERALKNIATVDDPNNPDDEMFLQLHRELLTQLEEKCIVIYHSSLNKIFINDKLFGRALPAALFYYLCKQMGESNEKEFEYQSLIASSFLKLHLDPVRPSLDVRVARLRKKLAKLYPSLKIEMTGKGKFKFTSSSPIQISVIK
jgi:hypothetical protein